MAVRTWTGAVDSDWGTAGNWDTGVPADADTATFDVTSNVACTLTGADTCAVLTMTSDYTATLALGTTGLSVTGAVTLADETVITGLLKLTGAAAQAFTGNNADIGDVQIISTDTVTFS